MTDNEDLVLPDDLQHLCDSLSKLRPALFDPAMPDMLYAAGFAAGVGSAGSSQIVAARKSRNARVLAFLSGVGSGLLATMLISAVVYSVSNVGPSSAGSAGKPTTHLLMQQESETIDNDISETPRSLSVTDQHAIPEEMPEEAFDVSGLSPVMQKLASQQLVKNEIPPRRSNHVSDSSHLHYEPLRRLSVWEEIR